MEEAGVLLPLTEKQQRRATLERMYETGGLKNQGFRESIKSFYFLTIGYFTNRPKYDMYWEITEFLYEKKYGKKYGD